MQNSEEHVSKPTKPLKRQQPQDIWLIVYWFIEFVKIVGLIRNSIWLLRTSVRGLRRLYHAVMWFLRFKIQRYVIFEKPHARAVSQTVGMCAPSMERLIIFHVPIQGHECEETERPRVNCNFSFSLLTH